MKTITKTYKVYNFNELTDGAKENAKNIILEIYHNNNYINDCLQEELNEIYLPNSFTDLEFCLCCCQSDFLHINGKISFFDLLSKLQNEFTQEQQELLSHLQDCFSFDMDDLHKYGEFEPYLTLEYSNEKEHGAEDITIMKFCELATDYMKDLELNLYNYGIKLATEIDDDEICTLCEWDGINFLENGKIDD